MTQTVTTFEAFSALWKPRIEQRLDTLCPKNGRLQEAMRYSLLSGGKRLRPLLSLLSAFASGADPAKVLDSGCAVEMVHAFSLIHDDLPCMDDDDLRRGKPTNHKVHGEAMALLAGDALLAQAFSVLSDDASRHILSGATLQMIEGQVLDMTAESQKTIDQDFLDTLNAKKTGALISASLELGAIGTDAQKKSLMEYGRCMGLVFQITDDLLDATGDEAAAGKRVGKDAEKGKKTYPMILGIDKSRTRASALTEEAIEALGVFGKEADPLRDLAQKLLERQA